MTCMKLKGEKEVKWRRGISVEDIVDGDDDNCDANG